MKMMEDTNGLKIMGFFLISFLPYLGVPYYVPSKASHSLTKNAA